MISVYWDGGCNNNIYCLHYCIKGPAPIFHQKCIIEDATLYGHQVNYLDDQSKCLLNF